MKHGKTLKRVLRELRPYRFFMFLSLLCGAATVAAQLLIPVLCGRAIDRMTGQVDFQGIARIAGIIGITALLGAISQHLLAVSNQHITYGAGRDLREKLSRKIHSLPLSYLDSHPSGDLLSRMIGDVDAFSDGLLMGFTQLFTGVLSILGTLGIMLYFNVAITAVVVILTPASLWVAGFIARHTRKYLQQQAFLRGSQTALVQELVEGQSVIRAFGHEQESMEQFDEVNEKLQKASLLGTFFSSLTNPSTRMVNNFVYGAVALVSGLYAIGGGITVGQLSVFLSYASQYGKPFNEISGVITELQNALYCAERVFEVLDAENQPAETDVPQVPEHKGSVEVKNISFSYVPEQKLMEEVTVSVKPGQHIAVVGPTGCGKTTLINLLMRFYDVQKGGISVDGENVQNMTRRELRSRFGMVLQDTWLKSGTVRENIAYGKPDAADEEIRAAARQAYADGFISRLPEGYDTVLEENGSNLSAGQRQLLCIARAMLCLPQILILDEATSSIDTRTEMKIQDAFDRMMAGRTSVVVAHRLSTIRQADQILVMQQGRITEQGTHEELLARHGFYEELYNSQFAEQ